MKLRINGTLLMQLVKNKWLLLESLCSMLFSTKNSCRKFIDLPSTKCHLKFFAVVRFHFFEWGHCGKISMLSLYARTNWASVCTKSPVCMINTNWVHKIVNELYKWFNYTKWLGCWQNCDVVPCWTCHQTWTHHLGVTIRKFF